MRLGRLGTACMVQGATLLLYFSVIAVPVKARFRPTDYGKNGITTRLRDGPIRHLKIAPRSVLAHRTRKLRLSNEKAEAPLIAIYPSSRLSVALRCRSSKEDKEKQDKEESKKDNMDQMKKTLERAGYDSTMAKAKLEEWRSLGLNSSSSVRDHLVNGAVKGLLTKFGWLTFYATVTYLLYQWSLAGGEGQGGMIQIVLIMFTYINAYSFCQELLLFGTLAYATLQFASNPILLDAIKEIAGDSPEIPALNVKPQKVVDVLKVFASLQELNTRLRDMKFESSPLDALGSMLTLQSQDVDILCDIDYVIISVVFEVGLRKNDTNMSLNMRYDLNGDQRLEQEEVRLMLSDVGLNLEEEEVEEAIRILDSLNQDGYVGFDEFVAFWQNKLMQPEVTAAAAAEQEAGKSNDLDRQ
eukprot:jgi/Bigna1/136057/aug1.32_g10765